MWSSNYNLVYVWVSVPSYMNSFLTRIEKSNRARELFRLVTRFTNRLLTPSIFLNTGAFCFVTFTSPCFYLCEPSLAIFCFIVVLVFNSQLPICFLFLSLSLSLSLLACWLDQISLVVELWSHCQVSHSQCLVACFVWRTRLWLKSICHTRISRLVHM